MTFTITAELPLGTYRGAQADGQPESIPSVARLHSALLCAAGLGPRAVPRSADTDGWDPCDADQAALRWLEENPPDSVSLPTIEVNRGRATAFRNDGTIKSAKGSIDIKKFGKKPDMSVAVDGAFRWSWSQNPPPRVTAALEALCPDVAHLGTTESPVRLVTTGEEVRATHALDPEAGLFTGAGGRDVEIPTAGRVAELRAAHAATQVVPALRRDSYASDEWSKSPPPPRESVAVVRYSPVSAPATDVPWPEVLLLPLEWRVPERDRVRLAVAAHRALIEAIDEGVPPLVTGAYLEGARKPANRLAIQVLDQDMPADLGGSPAALALLIPRGTQPGDLDALSKAVAALPFVRGRGGKPYRITARPQVRSGAAFWAEPQPGMLRLWRTAVPAVPDTRGVRDQQWTFLHAALLSLGYVWKEQLAPVPGRGDQRQLATVDAVNAAGAVVLRATPVRDNDLRPWVHKVHPDAVVRPYRAQLWLGDLGPACALQAMGQSRHLGGGLLVPIDVPAGAGAGGLSWD